MSIEAKGYCIVDAVVNLPTLLCVSKGWLDCCSHMVICHVQYLIIELYGHERKEKGYIENLM